MVSKGRLGLAKFVELTATAPAKIYNLHPRKGSIAVGSDADLIVWHPKRQVTLTDATFHDCTGYTPFAGRTVKGWPETVLRRGEIVVRDGEVLAKPGSGKFLPRSGGWAAAPLGRALAEIAQIVLDN
jgi:dihydropyrimidinase